MSITNAAQRVEFRLGRCALFARGLYYIYSWVISEGGTTKTKSGFANHTGRGNLSSMKFEEAALTGTEDSRVLAEKTAEHHSVYCPNCSHRLTGLRCKLVCQSCGYYLSCADYY